MVFLAFPDLLTVVIIAIVVFIVFLFLRCCLSVLLFALKPKKKQHTHTLTTISHQMWIYVVWQAGESSAYRLIYRALERSMHSRQRYYMVCDTDDMIINITTIGLAFANTVDVPM